MKCAVVKTSRSIFFGCSFMNIVVICHNIRSRENVGAIFRTSDAFGVGKIYLTGYTPTPPHEKISKTALGAENWIPWEKVSSPVRLIKKLKKEGITVIALEKNKKSRDINTFSFKTPQKPIALILGNEVSGVPKKICDIDDYILHIPMRGKKESLNVAVALGIALYYFTK